ncbi:MAG: hypothetical protein ABI579_06370, partial [Candidatus Sumerlaeota bacterium]
MNVSEYERMYSLEDTYWWFQGRMRMIEAILDRYMRHKPRRGRVLDVSVAGVARGRRPEDRPPP